MYYLRGNVVQVRFLNVAYLQQFVLDFKCNVQFSLKCQILENDSFSNNVSVTYLICGLTGVLVCV